jgi:hypothetical protein
MQAGLDAALFQQWLWKEERILYNYIVLQLDNFNSQIEFTFGQKYFL